MTAPEDDPFMYLESYDYEYDDICYLDFSLDLPDRLLIFLSCLGLSGNFTVLWVLLRYIKLRTMTDVCLLNLALSDLMLAAYQLLWVYHFPNLALCKLMALVFQLGFYSGTFFVTLMSVDRYLAIVHAVAAMRTRTLQYGVIASITVWVISIIVGIPQVIFVSVGTDPDGSTSHCQLLYPEDMYRFWNMMQNFSKNTVGLFVCLPIMIFCYVKIFVVLSKCRNTKKDRAVKLIFTIVCVFVVCWMPYNVLVFLQTLQLFDILISCEAAYNINSAMYYSAIIALCHCCVNPVIYAFVYKKFKKSVDMIVLGVSTDTPAGENDIRADGISAAETPQTERHPTHL